MFLIATPAHGDMLLDSTEIFQFDECEEMVYGQQFINDISSEPEHFSWDLGTNDSLPELIIIVEPYVDSDIY